MRILTLFAASLIILAACSPPGSTPSPAASASPAASPATSASPAGTLSTSSAVTLTPEAYATYLGCMHEKHPDKGYLTLQQLVKSGIYTQNWSTAYKLQADASIKINTAQYGKECGA